MLALLVQLVHTEGKTNGAPSKMRCFLTYLFWTNLSSDRNIEGKNRVERVRDISKKIQM